MPNPERTITANGETRTLNEWAKRTGLAPSTIRSRIDYLGHTPEQALATKATKKFDPRRKKPDAMPRACPNLRKHVSGQAYVRWQWGGEDHSRYFGQWGSPEAKMAWRRFQVEWASGSSEEPKPGRETVAALSLAYYEFIKTYYVKDGKPTSEQHGIRAALTLLVELYGRERVADMKGRHIEAIQNELILKKLVRTTINQYVWRICRMFRWGVGKDRVPPDVAATLESVKALQPGRTPPSTPIRSCRPRARQSRPRSPTSTLNPSGRSSWPRSSASTCSPAGDPASSSP